MTEVGLGCLGFTVRTQSCPTPSCFILLTNNISTHALATTKPTQTHTTRANAQTLIYLHVHSQTLHTYILAQHNTTQTHTATPTQTHTTTHYTNTIGLQVSYIVCKRTCACVNAHVCMYTHSFSASFTLYFRFASR